MSTSGLLHAYVLDGKGGGQPLADLEAVARWKPTDGVLWINLDYIEAAAWLKADPRINPVMLEALTDNDPRPRMLPQGDDLLVIIRGINNNEGAEPEDMVSIRCYVERDRVVTLRHRRSRSLETLAADLTRTKGPRSAPELLVQLVDRIIDNVAVRVDNLGDAVAALEDQVLTETRKGNLRAQIADHRRRAIALRRFLAPQRDALNKLAAVALPWFEDAHRDQFVESADKLTRTVEELDAARDRASVTQEELSSRVAELTNQRLYVLSMITAVFLPLGFVCSLLGVNVGGVPFQHDDWAFWALIGLFAAGVGVQLWLFKKRGWL